MVDGWVEAVVMGAAATHVIIHQLKRGRVEWVGPVLVRGVVWLVAELVG